MEKAKALIAVALFIGTLIFTAYTHEVKPVTGKSFETNNVISPVLQDTIYKIRVTSL